MSFRRPTISDIFERVKGDFRAGLGITAILRRSFLFAIGKGLTGVSHELHGRASWIAKQLFVDQMEAEYLDRYGAIYALPRKAATYTKLNVKFTGTAGTTIPILTEITRSDGVTYSTDDVYTIQTASAAVAEITEIDTVADSGGSLNNTYFFISSPNDDYYVWINVGGTGTDPAIVDRTGVEVAISANDPANTVAFKVVTEIHNLADFNATVATNTITVTCVNTGAVDNATDGAVVTGFSFTITTEGADAVIGGEVDGVITADNAGADSNTDAGETLTLVNAIVNVDSELTVLSTDTEGEDVEADEAYRQRILDRIREAPHGGNVNDYIQWAKSVAGVTRAWVLPDQLGAGTVLLWFVEDNDQDIFPDAAKIAEVQEYIDGVRPITATVFVASPSPVDMDLTIKIKPNTQAVRDAVTAEINDLIVRTAVPHGALKNAGTGELYDGAILISKIREAISIAAGEYDHELVSPTTNFTVTTGQMVRLGTINWQTLA